MFDDINIFYNHYRWVTGKEIIFGLDSIKKLGDKIKYFNADKVLVVSDKGIKKSGNLDKVLNILKKIDGLDTEVFIDVEAEPSLSTAEKIVKRVSDGVDLVVGVGGGSVLDVSKLGAIMAGNVGDIKNYIGLYKIKKPGVPKILIPTTAGTGSEISEAIVLNKPEENTKLVVYSEYAPGDVVILDPRLTLTLPPTLTASTGMDALSHAIESYMSRDSTPFSEAFSEKAMYLIGRYLRKAYFNGLNIVARYNMLLAATLASMSWAQSGVCQGHAIGLALGVKYHLPHGISVALALPYVMWFNRMSITEKLAYIGYFMGVEENNIWIASKEAVKNIVQLMTDLNIPTALSDIKNTSKDDVEELAEASYKAQRLLVHSPRHTGLEDLRNIIELMFEGLDL